MSNCMSLHISGYGDYVRCFFCGGGLRNWEPGDDPWVCYILLSLNYLPTLCREHKSIFCREHKEIVWYKGVNGY